MSSRKETNLLIDDPNYRQGGNDVRGWKVVRTICCALIIGFSLMSCGSEVPEGDRDVDCSDAAWAGTDICRGIETRCKDGRDNDDDGYLDCMDTDCENTDECTMITGGYVRDYDEDNYLIQTYEQWITTVQPDPIYVAND